MEKSFIMIKPDGVRRKFIGGIVNRIEKKGFNILEAQLMRPSRQVVEEHYSEHKEKPFFPGLVDFILGGPVFAMVVEGDHVIEVMRLMIGDKDPRVADPGTIRGEYAYSTTENIIHGSDSLESAEREISLWFK